MNTYKDQFAEWSPAYPVMLLSEAVGVFDLETHNITIRAIIKAMEHNNG